MTTTSSSRRRRLLGSARLATAFCGSMLALSALSFVAGRDAAVAAAGTLRGTVTFSTIAGPTTTGGSAPFTLQLPSGAACQGGGPAGYKWEAFLVSASVDVGAISWVVGPTPVAGALVTSMFDVNGDQVTARFPSTNPVGLISGIPQLSLANTVSPLPIGSYTIGIACTFNGQTQDHWAATLAVTADGADTPLGIAWTAAPSTPVTTTTVSAATTTTVAATTTTVARPSTTTTIAGSTTTSVVGATTTTAPSTGTSFVASFPATGGGGGGGLIPATGTSSSIPLVVWGLLTVVFGRMAILLARPVRVAPTAEPARRR